MKKLFVVIAFTVLAAASLFSQGARATYADERDFIIYNQSDVSITGLYVAPAASSIWGDNQLSNPITPGSSFRLHFQPSDVTGACVFDIRFIGSDGSVTYDWGVDLCATDSVTYS